MAQAQAAEAAPRTKTVYTVLQVVDLPEGVAGTGYAQLGNFEGANDVEAVRAAVEARGIEQATLVAVPARSFRPRTVSVAVRRSVSFG